MLTLLLALLAPPPEGSSAGPTVPAPRADLVQIQDIGVEIGVDRPLSLGERIEAFLGWLPGFLWSGAPVVVVVGQGLMALEFYRTGRRQQRKDGGRRARLLTAIGLLSVAQLLPVVAGLLLVRFRPELRSSLTFVLVVGLVWMLCGAVLTAFLRPFRLPFTKTSPPLLEDPEVLARVEQLATHLGIPLPTTYLLHSASARQTNQAMLFGLVSPTLVLFDGILHRFSPEERDFIIAHELAHFANHTMWYRVALIAGCSLAVVACSAFFSVWIAPAFGYAVLRGAWLIVSRRLELDCDRRAACAVGHRRAASALWKIHADQPFRSRPVLELLIGATEAHPSRDERLAAVRAAATADDRPDLEWEPRTLPLRHLAGWGATGLWLAGLLLGLVWASSWPASALPVVPLLAVALFPDVVLWLGLRQAANTEARLRRSQQRRAVWERRLLWGCTFLIVGFLAADLTGQGPESLLGPDASQLLTCLVCPCLSIVSMILVIRTVLGNHLEQQVAVALQTGDYSKVLELCERKAAVVARSSLLRHQLAVSRAVLGQRDEAIRELEQLRQDDSGFRSSWLALISLYADQGDLTRALELAAELNREPPAEVAGLLAEARVLRRLGRHDEAEARARAVLAAEPESGYAWLILAGVALDRGDTKTARELLARADRLVPGTVEVRLLTAEVALATNAPEAEAAVRQAVAAARNTPLAFAGKTAAALERLHEGVLERPDCS